jgi:hypothetical protein
LSLIRLCCFCVLGVPRKAHPDAGRASLSARGPTRGAIAVMRSL